MTKEELKVCIEAVRWWKAKCPVDMTEAQHHDFAAINCVTEYEIRLALAVSKLLKVSGDLEMTKE